MRQTRTQPVMAALELFDEETAVAINLRPRLTGSWDEARPRIPRRQIVAW